MSSQQFLPTVNPTRHTTGSVPMMTAAASGPREEAVQGEQPAVRIFDDQPASHYDDMKNGPSAWDQDPYGEEERPRD